MSRFQLASVMTVLLLLVFVQRGLALDLLRLSPLQSKAPQCPPVWSLQGRAFSSDEDGDGPAPSAVLRGASRVSGSRKVRARAHEP